MIKHLYCDVIPDAVSIIDLNSLQVLGYPTLSDTFRYRVAVTDFGVAMLDPRPHGGSVRIGTDNPDIGILLLQIKGDSRQSPTGTNRCNKSSDFLFSLMPELGPGCPVMSQSVGNIIELIRPKTVGRFFSHSLRDTDIIIGILVGFFRNGSDFCSHRPKPINLFLGLSLRNYDNGAIAPRISNQS